MSLLPKISISIFYNLILIVSALFFSSFSLSYASEISINREEHPRLIINKSLLSRVKRKNGINEIEDYKQLLGYAYWRIQSTKPKEIADKHYHPETIIPLIFCAITSDDKKIVEYAKECAVSIARKNPSSGDDTAQRVRLLSISLSYDWLHDFLSPIERMELTKGIQRHVNILRYFLNQPKYTGGHWRFGSIALMAAIFATYGESVIPDEELLLEKIKLQWSEGYIPFQEFAALDGGYVMGWQYGAGYTSLWPYMFGKRLKIDWLQATWVNELPLWYLYGLRGDLTFPRSGDCNDSRIGQHLAMIMAYCSGEYRNRYAEWFYRTYFNKIWGPYRVWRIIFRDPSVEPLNPEDSHSSLLTARHFRGSGFVIARDGWDSNSTQLVFKSSPYYSINHQHKDQNHFELSYKGSLLIDSGCYDRYGSSHWQNYYTRTIAHNSLIVHSPDEEFLHFGKKLSNDGGQNFRNTRIPPFGEEPSTLQETLTEKYKLNGVIEFAVNDGVTWIKGDASKAYSTGKLTKYIRNILMINKPEGRKRPFIFISDHVVLTKPLIPKILFHSNERPEITGNRFRISNEGGGILNGIASGSSGIKIELIGGHNKESWVDGKNYFPITACREKSIDVGSWRVEISTINRVKEAKFFIQLAIDDHDDSLLLSKTDKVYSEDFVGFKIGRELFLIFFEKSSINEWIITDQRFGKVKKVIAGGLPLGREYRLILNGRTISSEGPDFVIVGDTK